MSAKAIAKDCGATFINVRMSMLQDKWFGESQKLIRALFSLAHKLEPTIIFIDEIDSFLRKRNISDHEVMSNMKAEFMSLWDGLLSADSSRVIILGATNRPNDIDPAILRRLPRQFLFEMPDLRSRVAILKLILKDESVSHDLNLNEMAQLTQGYSGSDLMELCRCAALIPVREHLQSKSDNDTSSSSPSSSSSSSSSSTSSLFSRSLKNEEKSPSTHPRPVCKADFVQAMQSILPTGEAAATYETKSSSSSNRPTLYFSPINRAQSRNRKSNSNSDTQSADLLAHMLQEALRKQAEDDHHRKLSDQDLEND